MGDSEWRCLRVIVGLGSGVGSRKISRVEARALGGWNRNVRR